MTGSRVSAFPNIDLETYARELGVLSAYEKDGERMKWMHDLNDYSDYTAEIVRGALLDAHDALCELIGEPRKQPRRWPKLEASPHGCGSWQQNNPPGRRTALQRAARALTAGTSARVTSPRSNSRLSGKQPRRPARSSWGRSDASPSHASSARIRRPPPLWRDFPRSSRTRVNNSCAGGARPRAPRGNQARKAAP